MSTEPHSFFGLPILRTLGALLFLLAYFCSYFPFASVVGHRVMEGGGSKMLWAPLVLMGLALLASTLLACTFQLRPRARPARTACWLCLVSWVASFLGVILISVPQHGHPSIGIFFFVVPVQVNAVIIPIALLLFAISFMKGERLVIPVAGLLYLLAASFFFSGLRFGIPAVMDSLSGTKYFSRAASRLDIGLEIECPNSQDMAEDPALIKKCPLTFEKMNQLENVVAMAPQYRCIVLEEILNQLPSVKDFELKRRLLMMAARLHPNLVPDEKCEQDLVLYFCGVMKEKNADISDVAARCLALQLYPILSSDRYQDCADALAKYALERQVNPPQQLEFADGRKYLYWTFDCVSELNGVTANLLQHTEPSVADRKAATNLALFLPYLRARQTDDNEGQRQFNARICSDVISRIEQLQSM